MPTKQNFFVLGFLNLGLTVCQNYFTHPEPRQALDWMKTHARIQKVLSEGIHQLDNFFSMMRGGMIQMPLLAGHQMAFRWRADNGPILNAGLVAL